MPTIDMQTFVQTVSTLTPFVTIVSFTLIAMIYSKEHFPQTTKIFFFTFTSFLVSLSTIGIGISLTFPNQDINNGLMTASVYSFVFGLGGLVIASVYILLLYLRSE